MTDQAKQRWDGGVLVPVSKVGGQNGKPMSSVEGLFVVEAGCVLHSLSC